MNTHEKASNTSLGAAGQKTAFFCEENVAKNIKIAESDFLRQRRSEFARMCPSAYRNPDLSRLRALAPEQHDQAMSWTFGQTGLLLCGAGHLGKTRTAWQLILRELLKFRWTDDIVPGLEGRSIKTYDSLSWHIDTQLFSKPDTTGLAEWQSGMRSCDLVFIDEPFMHSINSNHMYAFWAMLEERTSRGKPTIVTMNGDMRDLLDRTKESEAKEKVLPIAGRLKEYFSIVEYKKTGH